MCYNPVKVKYHDNYKNYRGILINAYNEGRYVPCGKCLACRERYIESWQIRWSEQLKVTEPESSYMITLTYREENIPLIVTPDGELKTTLDYTDVQKFLKRLRKKQDTYCKKNGLYNPPIKYHGAGEYGKNFTKRPHYHILLTNVVIPIENIQCKKTNTFSQIWKNGNVDVGTDVTPNTINYILKYTLKEYHSSKKPVKYVQVRQSLQKFYPFGKAKKAPEYINQCLYPWVEDLVKTHIVCYITTENVEKTLFKYNPKGSENEYRVAEKAFLSKGIGKNYLTTQNINYHLNNIGSTYDFYDHKKRVIKQKPLPKYYSDQIYNPILKVNGKNQYDADKKPIRLHNIKDMESYTKTPLFQKQLRAYKLEHNRFNDLLKKYNCDIHLLTVSESKNRKITAKIALDRRKTIEEFQRHSNKINNLYES